MSWSVTFIGNPENIIKALEAESEKLLGQSKEEFDSAKPHLIGLVGINFELSHKPVLELIASGHGQKDNYGFCMVNLRNLGGKIV